MSRVRPTPVCAGAGRQRRGRPGILPSPAGSPTDEDLGDQGLTGDGFAEDGLAGDGVGGGLAGDGVGGGDGLAVDVPAPFAPALRASLGPLLADIAEDMCVRVGVVDGADPHPVARDALLAIAGEAVASAVGQPELRTVEVSITAAGSGWHLTVRDDGPGLALATRGSGVVGAMEDQARAAGGTLEVRCEPDRGTLVEAVLP